MIVVRIGLLLICWLCIGYQVQAQQTPPKPRPSRVFRTGDRLQDFTAYDLQGNRLQLKAMEGKVVVMNFWFINCTPCQREMPELNQLVQEFNDTSKVVFLAIALDRQSNVDTFLNNHPFLYTILPAGRPLATLYRIQQYPTHVIADKTGRVIFHSTGYSTGTAYWLRKKIKEQLQ